MIRLEPFRVFLTLISLWCVLIVLPPILAAVDGPSSAIYLLFSRICHQDVSRSLVILGHPLAVCTRCSTIYFGFFVGVLVGGLWRHKPENFKLWFVVILCPMILDVVLEFVGLHQTTQMVRILTGLVFGIGSGILLTPLLIEGLQKQLKALVASPDKNVGVHNEGITMTAKSRGISNAKT